MASSSGSPRGPLLRWTVGVLLIAVGVGVSAFGLLGPHNVYGLTNIVIGCACVAFGVLVLLVGFDRINRWGRKRHS